MHTVHSELQSVTGNRMDDMVQIYEESFGVTKNGEKVVRYTLENSSGMQVKIISYACAIQSILIPGEDGNPRDVVLGYDDLEGYESGSSFFGAFVGRYANRIKNSEFTLNGRTYHLEPNDGPNHLHGSFCHQVYRGRTEAEKVIFDIQSPDGEEGYPGTVYGTVEYELTEENELILTYRMETDADTVLNLTNHSYFNLNGQNGKTILAHTLRLNSDCFTEGDAQTLPTGRILPVDGGPMDFRNEKKIGNDISSEDDQIQMCQGYDHNFVIHREADGPVFFAEAMGDESKIRLRAYTTQPGFQLYTGNFVQKDAARHGKNGIRYPQYGGFCLETQHYPCSPNYPEFPDTVLRPGEVYEEKTCYQFLW